MPGEECPPGGAPSVTRLHRGHESALRYCGQINAAGVRAVEDMISDTDIALVITSFGGELDAPVRLAELVAARGLDVEVVGPCFSGCAAFVFIAGNRRVVTSAGILGFHNTASSAALLGLRSLDDDAPSGFAPILARASREWQLYLTKGVGFSLLYEPQVRIDTICTRPRGTHSISGERVIDILSSLDFWLPAPGTLREAGISFEGSLPATERDAARRFQAYMPSSVPVPKFTANNKRLAGSPESHLYAIPGCPEPPRGTKPPAAAPQSFDPVPAPPDEEPRKLRPRDDAPAPSD